MNITTFPLDLTDYTADALGAWFAARTRGVFAAEGHYHITANGDMTITVKTGLAWLRMTEHWGVVAFNQGPVVLEVPQAENATHRVDAVCLQLDKAANLSRLLLRTGTPGESEPPAPVRDASFDEVYLATIWVPAGAASVEPMYITDQRLNEELCGLMSDGTNIPTQQLYDTWMDWFRSLRTTLDEDTAGNLYNLITLHRDNSVPHVSAEDRERWDETAESFENHAAIVTQALRSYLPRRLVVTLLSSGTFRPEEHGLLNERVDVYMVGGGGGGSSSGGGAGGGGGGRCRLLRNVRLPLNAYSIVVGAGGASGTTGSAGGTTSAFGQSGAGGSGGAGQTGGAGGSGGGSTQGFGGSMGGDGGNGGGIGNGTNVFTPFNPYDRIAYGSGGGGSISNGGGAGGRGGGSPSAGHMGGGGGGANLHGANGGTGGLGGGGGGGGGGRGGAGLIYIYADPTLEALGAATERFGVLRGDATPAEIMAYSKICEARDITVGVLKDGVCIDSLIFGDIATAEQFLADGVWPDANGVAVLPEDCGIGDYCDGATGTWTKQEVEVSETPEAAPPTFEELEVKLLALQAQVEEAVKTRQQP